MTQTQCSSFRFTTEAFTPNERVAAWRDVYGQTIAKLEFVPAPEAPFTIEATMRNLPGLSIVSMETHGLSFAKPRNLLDSDDLILVTVERGGYCGAQLGREVTLGPGDAVIRLNGEVTSGRIFGHPSIIRVPTGAIAHRVGDVSAAIHRRIPADTDALRLLRPYMRAMQDGAATPETQHLAVTHVHDLIALLLGATGEAAAVARDRGARAARLRGIKKDVARNLEHGDVSLAAMAARHRISPRSIQKLFEGEGTTFSGYVLDQRLAYAHRLLSAPQRQADKIAAIAFTAGFGDVSYFYRTFRSRYGLLPSDVREQAQNECSR